jgi:NADPH:quinone reductase-like Zn-dependent oxidoreductase
MSAIDRYLSCTEAVKLLPPGRNSTTISPATITRWILRGCRAADGRRVKLRAVRIGFRWAVRETWLQEFFELLAANVAEPAITPRTPGQRKRALERANRELAASGI